MTFFAHSGSSRDQSDWQPLRDHLLAVAELAATMAAPLGLEKAASLAGLFHDLGKYTAGFQRRLTGADIRVDHSTAGAVMLTAIANGHDKAIAEIIGYAILGHHAGLPDRLNDTAACLERRVEQFKDTLDPTWRNELPLDLAGLVPAFAARFAKDKAAFQFSVMGRMIFSCLVDADFKDTEAFYGRLEGRRADRDWASLQSLLPGFRAAFDAHMAGMPAPDNALNRLRGDILAHIRGKAGEAPGLFTLTVPTGGGKTLASLGFALDHAAAHGHSRIIYAIPFTSIIDQTAAIFRGILGDANVLEHHSAIDEERPDPEQRREARDKLKLAMEDWAAPVVVTTNVQLFESLFAAKPSRARKLHNIAGSIIILDEAQTIPRPLLMPCIRMLEELSENYGCTIILCTATQPALDVRKLEGGLPLEGRELAPDPPSLARKLRRAHIRRVGPMDNTALIAALEQEPQALVVVNSRKHALELFKEAQAEGLDSLIHLTTRQYAVHRRAILDDARARLEAGQPCRVIATSLIEAGVDVDFPKVWRAEAGLDQIVQAAGRCNREGRLAQEHSIVTVFEAPGYPPPAEIRGLIADARRALSAEADLLSLEAIEAYFGEVYWRMGARLDGRNILPRLTLSRSGTDFAYRSVAQDFRMIESGMAPVIVARDEAARKAVDELADPSVSSGVLARKLQGYAVQVSPIARGLLISGGHAGFRSTQLRGDQFEVLQTDSLYREDVGLLWENAKYLSAENTVI